jgi:hypothetical protein
MANTLYGFNWTSIGTINGGAGAGTVAVTNRETSLVRVIVPGTYVGTVNFHDAATAAGTTATSMILSLGIPNTNIGGNIEVGAKCAKGLLYQATGTPVITFIWD